MAGNSTRAHVSAPLRERSHCWHNCELALNNSNLKPQTSNLTRPLLTIVGLMAAAALLWLLYLYIFVWRNTPHLAQLVGA
jgi:ABC-type amino acid transport system permease subunit